MWGTHRTCAHCPLYFLLLFHLFLTCHNMSLQAIFKCAIVAANYYSYFFCAFIYNRPTPPRQQAKESTCSILFPIDPHDVQTHSTHIPYKRKEDLREERSCSGSCFEQLQLRLPYTERQNSIAFHKKRWSLNK